MKERKKESKKTKREINHFTGLEIPSKKKVKEIGKNWFDFTW